MKKQIMLAICNPIRICMVLTENASNLEDLSSLFQTGYQNSSSSSASVV